MTIGWGEVILILVLALVLFGAKKIPEIANAVGKGMREFKKGLNSDSEDPQHKDETK